MNKEVCVRDLVRGMVLGHSANEVVLTVKQMGYPWGWLWEVTMLRDGKIEDYVFSYYKKIVVSVWP